jgi:molecular chaperone Hsp33
LIHAYLARNKLTVSRDLGLKEPYIGSVELVSGEIAEDVTAYLLESEQVPSACALGVLVDTDTSVRAAGGFIVQLMPGADESLIGKLEDNIFLMDQVTTILAEDGAEELFAQVLKGIEYHITEETPVSYRCACNRERFARALTAIDRADLLEMVEDGEGAEIVCDFCRTKYVFTHEDLKALASAGPDAEE